MKAFFRNLLATITGLVIFTILAVLVIFGIFGAMAAAGDEVPQVRDNSVLYFRLSGQIVEQEIDDPFQEIFDDGPSPLGLRKVLNALRAAKEDDKIEGIYLESKFLMSRYASLQEIRDALLDFKASGKFIYAYGEYVSESDYFLMSVADSVYLNPEGSLEFNGLATNITFYKGLFEKLDIEPVIFRVGSFKSYVEPYTRKEMSEENRLQYSALLNSMYDQYLRQVSDSRGAEMADLEVVSDSMKIQFAEDAKKYGLADLVAFEDEAKSQIRSNLGIEEEDKINFISVQDYAKVADQNSEYSTDKIAVIVADGPIVPTGDEEVIGGEEYARLIRKARQNDRVKAIVLRVNSPGGSLLGSDLIWREVQLTKGVKPIIASMADVAASGGYYISMAADTIVAQPNTITGSIGIFSMLFNFEEFMDNKLGLTTDAVGTGAYSDFITVTRPLTDYEKQVMQNGVEEGYRTFTTKAAEGRGMPVKELKKVAEGRVWSGEQAKELGLVDVLGSYEDAIQIAADAAGLEEYSLRMYPKPKPFFEKLMEDFGTQARSVFAKDHILASYEKKLKALRQLEGIQARMPGELEVQ